MRRAWGLLALVLAAGSFVGWDAAPSVASSPAALTFTSSQVGTVGTTPAFTMSGPWSMHWSYQCASDDPTGSLLVSVSQPSGDSHQDTGPNEVGTSGSGTDYYFDSGSFTLMVVGTCAWTITVTSSTAGPAALPVTYSSTATGQSGTTRGFLVSGSWTLLYRYTCTGSGTTAGLSVDIESLTGKPTTLFVPAARGESGTGSMSFTAGGAYYLAVSSVCNWTIGIQGKTAFTRIYGQTVDATAADALEHQFPSTAGDCPGTTSTRPVVLATDATYPDALASSYLARALGTGLLLTTPGALSSPAAAAIAAEGITRVDVVGGALAVSTAVVSTLEKTDGTTCGGKSSPGGGHLTVVRISGTTPDTTAEKIAETPSPTLIGAVDLSGAYGGTNAAGGTGMYNQTSGDGSAAPSSSGSLRTAIVASGQGFQDAEAASTLSYAERLPILLTTPASLSAQASAAIAALGVTQVVVVGGPLAVSNAVVAALEGLGVSVLRVAGSDYTATAVDLAELETTAAPRGFGWAGTGSVTVARGDSYADGLAGAAVAADGPNAQDPSPMLLSASPTTVGAALTSFLRAAGSTGIGGEPVTHLVLLGGPFALSPTVIEAMVADL